MKKLIFLLLVCTTISINAQYTIEPTKGYSQEIGTMVSMLQDLKGRVTQSVVNLNQEQTDYLLDEKANRIGALILHLAATEKYYQLYTFENHGFTDDMPKFWETALSLGEPARKKIIDKPISYYLKIWDDVRNETLRLLKTKDDAWFASRTDDGSMNNHWAWYHVMEHQANHMGQIRLLLSRLPK